MILMYHKVHPDSPTMWWVTVNDFYRQLCELQAYEVVSLDDYDPTNPNHVVITFDGVYGSILEFAVPLLKRHKYPFELFIAGDHVGKDNSFDQIDKRTKQPTNEPLTYFATPEQLKAMVAAGGRLQWHSKSHPNLVECSPQQLATELSVPKHLKSLDPNGFTWFAYPHGEFNAMVKTAVKRRFNGGLSVIQGDDLDVGALNRITVTNERSFARGSIGVIIPSYNYGRYLVEAIESVLHQTRPANQILIIDDGSTDNTKEIGEVYANRYPIVQYVRNEKNQGIITTFRSAVERLNTDYICFLGADNRFMSNYLEKTATILDTNHAVAIAYTDFALFGPLASSMYSRFPPDKRGKVIEDSLYLINFPNYSAALAKNISQQNFIHGSSLYRKQVYESVHGYLSSEQAEDHNLFSRMIMSGWKAKKTSGTYLEYRQHSRAQANTQLISQDELLFYRNQFIAARDELQRIKNSTFWKLLYLYKEPKQAFRRYATSLLIKLYRSLLGVLG